MNQHILLILKFIKRHIYYEINNNFLPHLNVS